MDGKLTVHEGPTYRMYDKQQARWIRGREACIDALVRRYIATTDAHGLPEPHFSVWRANSILSSVLAAWPRAVFR